MSKTRLKVYGCLATLAALGHDIVTQAILPNIDELMALKVVKESFDSREVIRCALEELVSHIHVFRRAEIAEK